MVKEYLEKLTKIMENACPTRLKKGELVVKHFFDGAAVYAHKKIFIRMTPAGFAIKLPEKQCNELIGNGGKAYRCFPKTPIKKGYVVLSESKLRDLTKLKRLINTSIQYVTDQ